MILIHVEDEEEREKSANHANVASSKIRYEVGQTQPSSNSHSHINGNCEPK